MQPVFVVAVPRSGSTMLRLMLNAHPSIYSGKETPWFGGNYGVNSFAPEVSVRCLYRRVLAEAPENQKCDVTARFADFVRSLIEVQLRSESKQIWIEKTPDNIIQAPFLHRLFPEGKFIRILRDGRDVALSTLKAAEWSQINYFIDNTKKNRRFINLRRAWNRRVLSRLPSGLMDIVGNSTLEPARKEEPLSIFFPIANTFHNAMYRWQKWNQLYDEDVRTLGVNQLSVRYEDMLAQPEATFSAMFKFLGIDFDPRIFDYAKYQGDVDKSDLGVRSAMKFSSVDSRNAYKWKSALTTAQRAVARKHFDDYLASLGYERTT